MRKEAGVNVETLSVEVERKGRGRVLAPVFNEYSPLPNIVGVYVLFPRMQSEPKVGYIIIVQPSTILMFTD